MRRTDAGVSERPRFKSTLGALVSHPTRVAAYVILFEREASPREIADQLRKDVRHVGYHVRKLRELNLIELVREKPVRGTVAHYYKAVEAPLSDKESWSAMTPEERHPISRLTLQLIATDAAEAIDSGTLDGRPDQCLVRVPIGQMDDEGFAELHELHARLYEDTTRVMGNVANRKAADPDHETFPAVAAAMFFERPRGDWTNR